MTSDADNGREALRQTIRLGLLAGKSSSAWFRRDHVGAPDPTFRQPDDVLSEYRQYIDWFFQQLAMGGRARLDEDPVFEGPDQNQTLRIYIKYTDLENQQQEEDMVQI